MYHVMYKKAALKSLVKIPKNIRMKISIELSQVAINPNDYMGDWKPLAGSPYWRLRVGGYRAICDIQDNALVLLVLKIGPRGGIYK